MNQIKCFVHDYKRACGKYRFRAFYLWMNWGIIGVFFYRLERKLYLLLGGGGGGGVPPKYSGLSRLLSSLLFVH